MKSDPRRLEAVDRVELVTLVDNYVDILLPNGVGVQRPGLARQGAIPRSTLLAEHGLSLLVTVHKNAARHSVLLDTGYNSSTLLHNMEYLGLDPANIEAVVLSHGHMDHTGGLNRLLERLGPSATVVAHPEVFRKRFLIRPPAGRLDFPLTMDRAELRNRNVVFLDATAPVYLAMNRMLVSGQIPRTTAFEKGMPGAHLEEAGQVLPDAIKDDQALVVNIAGHGLAVISGCAHAGIINSIIHAIELTGESRVAAVIGGFHLSGTDMEPVIEETVNRLKQFAPRVIMPMHCTGWNALRRLQSEFPESFVLSSVGTRLVVPRDE